MPFELDEATQGYMDGRNPDAPDPSANRSFVYRHSFMVGRDEIAGAVKRAATLREMAAVAELRDREL